MFEEATKEGRKDEKELAGYYPSDYKLINLYAKELERMGFDASVYEVRKNIEAPLGLSAAQINARTEKDRKETNSERKMRQCLDHYLGNPKLKYVRPIIRYVEQYKNKHGEKCTIVPEEIRSIPHNRKVICDLCAAFKHNNHARNPTEPKHEGLEVIKSMVINGVNYFLNDEPNEEPKATRGELFQLDTKSGTGQKPLDEIESGGTKGDEKSPRSITPEEKKAIELQGMKVTTDFYRWMGYSVQDVSAEKVGYDLLCQAEVKELCVEVKGTTSNEPEVNITPNEKKFAQDNPTKAVLAIVSGIEISQIKGKPVAIKGALQIVEDWHDKIDLEATGYKGKLRS